MCRFLIINTKKPFSPTSMVARFSLMCKGSPRWQGDGWGAAWMGEAGKWDSYLSTKPIWEDKEGLEQIGDSKLIAVHARGASFKKHKDNVEYNQPFIRDGIAFVFNGFLSGVSLPFLVDGEIGSERIFNLFLRNRALGLDESLLETKDTLKKHSREIEALNIGVLNSDTISVLCSHTTTGDYHKLVYTKGDNSQIFCSRPFGDYEWEEVGNNNSISVKTL